MSVPRHRMMHGRHRGLAGAVALLALGCGGDPPQTPPPPVPTFEERVDEAWALYLAGTYPQAQGAFFSLAAERDSADAPWLGLSWCAGQRDSLPRAAVYAQAALARRRTEDAWVALAVARAAMGLDSLALDALERGFDPPYRFSRDRRVTDRGVRRIQARALFNLRRYDACLAVLLELDPTLQVDLGAWDFREQLAAALESAG